MTDEKALADLASFARKCLNAERFPEAILSFSPAECPSCGVVPLVPTIEHHTGSRAGNFRGVMIAQCSQCGMQPRIFSFTGKHRRRSREEKPSCSCGNRAFLIAECERIERDAALGSFFDEGVVVGKCARCGRNHAFVYTD
jgi:hypothetical protein